MVSPATGYSVVLVMYALPSRVYQPRKCDEKPDDFIKLGIGRCFNGITQPSFRDFFLRILISNINIENVGNLVFEFCYSFLFFLTGMLKENHLKGELEDLHNLYL